MRALPFTTHPNLLVGCQTFDDAGVYKLTDDLALVQTLDFFTPIVDDPYHFGRIAAANALSDIYAMGGRPLTAMNIVCFPIKELPKDVLKEILKGGMEKIQEAGAVLVGGHSVDDKELKYGLSVTGLIHPDRIVTNQGARTGDKLILTKPIGTGIIATAIKGKMADRASIDRVIEVMSALNDKAAEIMVKYGAHACTDITGFGLGGHLLEMARAGQCEIAIYADSLPFLPGAREYALTGLIPAGSYAIKHFCEHSVGVDPKVESVVVDLIFDAQTSGGLAFSLEASKAVACLKELREAGITDAAIIGEIIGAHPQGRLTIKKGGSHYATGSF